MGEVNPLVGLRGKTMKKEEWKGEARGGR